MNTFWLKVAGVAVAVVLVIVLIGSFVSSESEKPTSTVTVEPKIEPETKQRTFYDQVEDDKKKFLTEPQPVEEQAQDREQRRKEPEESEVHVKTLEERKKLREQKQAEENQASAEKGPTILYFKPLSDIDEMEAERLLNMAVPGRSIGRLPMTGFKLMVETCRQIISRWPDSWYAYRAKQMIADMPERFRERYKITEQELSVSEFTKPRPGTEPFIIEDNP